MTTTQERLDALEEQGGRVVKPEKCIFCSSGYLDPYHKVVDPAVRDFLINEKQADACDHKTIGNFSLEFSNFIAAALLQYVSDNYLEKQNDFEFINKIFQDKEIMIPVIEIEARRYSNSLREGTLAYAKKKDEIQYWKDTIFNISIYEKWAKQMYEDT